MGYLHTLSPWIKTQHSMQMIVSVMGIQCRLLRFPWKRQHSAVHNDYAKALDDFLIESEYESTRLLIFILQKQWFCVIIIGLRKQDAYIYYCFNTNVFCMDEQPLPLPETEDV